MLYLGICIYCNYVSEDNLLFQLIYSFHSFKVHLSVNNRSTIFYCTVRDMRQITEETVEKNVGGLQNTGCVRCSFMCIAIFCISLKF